jgi:hypothetical protein
MVIALRVGNRVRSDFAHANTRTRFPTRRADRPTTHDFAGASRLCSGFSSSSSTPKNAIVRLAAAAKKTR